MIFGYTKFFEGCHIVPKAHSNCRRLLPTSVSNIIEYLPQNIDDVRNGLLLCPNLHHAFDDGQIAIKYERNTGRYIVIAITTGYEEYDGTLLWQTEHRFYKPPHPDLLDFHLISSVMKHLCASAEYDEDFDDPGSDFCIPEMQLVEAY